MTEEGMTQPTFDKIETSAQRSISISGIEGVEPRPAYSSKLYQPVRLSLTLSTPGKYTRGVSVDLGGPKLRKDGSHGKDRATEHFYDLTKVPDWVWEMLDTLGELTADERKRITEAIDADASRFSRANGPL